MEQSHIDRVRAALAPHLANLTNDAREQVKQLTDDELAVFNNLIQADFGDPTTRPGFDKIRGIYEAGSSGSLYRQALKQALADEVLSRPAFQRHLP